MPRDIWDDVLADAQSAAEDPLLVFDEAARPEDDGGWTPRRDSQGTYLPGSDAALMRELVLPRRL
jgi:hypothetical protein